MPGSPAPLFSIVSPIYRGEQFVEELVQRLVASLSELTDRFEIILVDDRSPDNAWARIQQQCALDARVQGVRLSRNFGQHAAITAGLTRCRAEWVVVLDGDLQDRPEEISSLYKEAQRSGAAVVLALREQRQHSWWIRWGSRGFYYLLAALTGLRQDSRVANFGLYNRRVIAAVLQVGDARRYFPTLVQWVGFATAYVPVTHAARSAGRSSYSLGRRLNLALDVLVAYSDRPLRLLFWGGTGLSAVSGLGLLTAAVAGAAVATQLAVAGLGLGVGLAVAGLLGLYLGRINEQIAQRPVFIVDELTAPAE